MRLTRELTDVEVRVLGCLVEKETTTPEQYPLTVNSLRLACNQKTNRFPTTEFTEGEVGIALRAMEALKLVKPAWGARAAKYEHTAKPVLDITTKELAVLYPMLVRGPQTAAEIRTRCHKHFAFDGVDDVEFVLKRMGDSEDPLVTQLPRQAGQKESRYAHLLAGEVDVAMQQMPTGSVAKSGLADRVTQLEEAVETLKSQIQALQGH